MAERPESSIEDRLAALEQAVRELRQQVDGLAGPDAVRERPHTPSSREGEDRMAALADLSQRRRPPAAPAPAGRDAPAATAAEYEPRRMTPDAPEMVARLFRRDPQFWVSRVGIGLLLAGVAYLFKYAVDQGWLTPVIRVVFGLGLGAALATIGLRVHRRERWFAQVMLGGASATWYITGFAAFQLLHVVSFPVAFGFLVVVTVLTFVASVRQNEASLAVLAAVGGLGTPFFLYTDAGSVPGLMAYTSVVLVGTSAIYYHKGWRSLLWTSVLGAWLVVALGFRTQTRVEQVALQVGALVIWFLFALVPILRELRRKAPSTVPSGVRAGRSLQGVAVLLCANALTTFFVSRAVWETNDVTWGLVALAGVGIYIVGAHRLSIRRDVIVLTSALGVTAAAFAAVASALLFAEHVTFALWAVEATVLHALARRLAARDMAAPDEAILTIDRAGHLLFAFVGFWMVQRLTELGSPEMAVFNAQSGANAVAILSALLAATQLDANAAQGYRLAAHAALLGWFWRELSGLPTGDGMVTAAWGLYAVALLLFARPARNVALATLFLAAGKLVVHDLSQVEPVWRILLFLSFGGVFLAISYFFTGLWKDREP